MGIATIWSAQRLLAARAAYHSALQQIHELEAYRERDPATITSADLESAEGHLRILDRDARRLDDATRLPVGGSLVEHVPWLGPRYQEGRKLLTMTRLLTSAGVTSTGIARDALAAFEESGVHSEGQPATVPTWLDVVSRGEPDLQAAAQQIDEARSIRAGLDERHVPESVRGRLATLDDVLDRVDYRQILDEDLPLLRTGLGTDTPRRYLFLFQNPAELRPSGGFPGTMGLVTIDRGQVRDYEIFDAHTLSDAYIAQNLTEYAQPWPIQEYFPNPSLVLHDATWWADFPRSGAMILKMYQDTDWPPIDGVVAVQPSVISALLRITGPVSVDVDGEQRVINADNVYDEIERQRRLHREGYVEDERHKQVLELIGVEIIERLEQADRGTLLDVARAMRAAADVRDVQIYMSDGEAQAWLDSHAWTGRIDPHPEVPTLAIVLANVVTNKASMRLVTTVTIKTGPAVDGIRDVTVDIWLKNTGSNEEDPFYAGFQRWWIDVWLPAGSERGYTHPEPMPDPDSPDGGSYLIAIFPKQIGYATIHFRMPDVPALLLRREPGVVPLQVTLVDTECGATQSLSLTSDTTINPGYLCR